MVRAINVLRTPWQLLAVCAVIIALAAGCFFAMEAPCEMGLSDGSFDFRGIAVEPRAYGHPENTVDRRVVTPEDDTLYQVIQRYDTLFGLELTAIDNDTLNDPPDPRCKPYGYVYSIRSLDVVSDADWDEDHPAGTSLNDLIDLKIALKDNPHYQALLAGVNFIYLFSSIDNQGKTFGNPVFIQMFLLFHTFPRPAEHHRLTVKMVKESHGNPIGTLKDTVLVRSVNVTFE